MDKKERDAYNEGFEDGRRMQRFATKHGGKYVPSNDEAEPMESIELVANEIVNHYMHKGARVSRGDYEYTIDELKYLLKQHE